ncbi:uncharacterized protein ACNLHF_015447 [Anomaloglossus baeobatrachus]|uniref:uncharacterized protein LOC142301716 n=1 Tax=Anomaloglossus baeobatrachus TaxID=238106 RepID=UPI003F4F5D0E
MPAAYHDIRCHKYPYQSLLSHPSIPAKSATPDPVATARDYIVSISPAAEVLLIPGTALCWLLTCLCHHLRREDLTASPVHSSRQGIGIFGLVDPLIPSRKHRFAQAMDPLNANASPMAGVQQELICQHETKTRMLAFMTSVVVSLNSLQATFSPAPDEIAVPDSMVSPASAFRLHLWASPWFNNDLKLCRGFLNQCSLKCKLLPHHFTSDQAKVAFLMSHLEGKASMYPSSIKPVILSRYYRDLDTSPLPVSDHI